MYNSESMGMADWLYFYTSFFFPLYAVALCINNITRKSSFPNRGTSHHNSKIINKGGVDCQRCISTQACAFFSVLAFFYSSFSSLTVVWNSYSLKRVGAAA